MMPIFEDSTDRVIKKISLHDLAKQLKNEVMRNGEIDVVEYDGGFKFIRKNHNIKTPV